MNGHDWMIGLRTSNFVNILRNKIKLDLMKHVLAETTAITSSAGFQSGLKTDGLDDFITDYYGVPHS